MLDFIRKEVQVTKESRQETESHQGTYEHPVIETLVTVTMDIGEDKLFVYLNPIEQSVSLGSNNISLVQQLGKRFNEELAKGKYQEFFGKYP